MSLRSTGFLALVALSLGLFIFWYEIEGESARQAVLDAEQRVFSDVESEDVESIELKTEDGAAARIERQDDHWVMTSPVAARADTAAADAMAHALASLPRAGTVSNAGELAQYGLSADARTIRFTVNGQPGTGILRVGGATPVGGHVYVSGSFRAGERGGDSDNVGHVEYVDSYRINAFKRKLDDLRDRQIVHLDSGALRTLRMTWSVGNEDVEVALGRDESGNWQMGVPVAGSGDQQTMRELISNLSYLRASEFIDVATDEFEAALANPVMTINWTLRGDHAERQLRIGLVDSIDSDSESAREGIVENSLGQRFKIDFERLNDFPRDVVAYRFKMLSSFDLVDAHGLEIEFSESEDADPVRVKASLAESGWQGSDPTIDPMIDPARASDLIRTLSSLRATDIFADEMGERELASLGLAPPRARIRVYQGANSDGDSDGLADVLIGRLDSRRGLFALRQGTPTVYLLPPSAAVDIPISLEGFVAEFEMSADGSDGDEETVGSEDLEIDPLEGIDIP